MQQEPTKLIIGLTGGIGSGKTAASDYFQTLGVDVIDADIEARHVVQAGSVILQSIHEHFGDDVLLCDGSLNRSWLRQRIFEQPEARHWLESLTHPAIRERITQQLNTIRSAYGILVSPLLFESGQHQLTHRTLLIDLPEHLQLLRTQQRDHNSSEQVKAIIRAQMSREERRCRADDIIVNDQDLDHLKAECRTKHSDYMTLAKQYPPYITHRHSII